MRHVTMNLIIKVSMDVDDGIEVDEVVENLDYEMYYHLNGADITNTEIMEHEVINSK